MSEANRVYRKLLADDSYVCKLFWVSEVSSVFREWCMSKQRERWADDACMRVLFRESKVSSVFQER